MLDETWVFYVGLGERVGCWGGNYMDILRDAHNGNLL